MGIMVKMLYRGWKLSGRTNDERFDTIKSRGDLLEDDIKNLKRSDGFRSEDVIEMKSDYHILRNFRKGMVLENEDSNECFV
nr:hypothetical protein [Tanacetum cinerariifolium]